MEPREVYLDNSATTRVDPRVTEAMLPYFSERYGNPNSLHRLGREAREAVDAARAKVAALINAEPTDIIFTGAGSESDNLAIKGAAWALRERGKGNHIITSAIEHHAILDTVKWLGKMGFEYTILPVDSRYDGRYDAGFSEWLRGYTDGVEQLKREVIGRSAAAYGAGEMNPLSNWVADAVYGIASGLTERKIDLAIINKGGIRQPLPEGDVSLGLVLTMLPFTNSVVVMEIDGKSLQEGLDVMAGRGGDAVSRQVCAGMKGGKAVDVMIDGKPLEPDKTYTVATIDYLANGGDNMASFAEKGKVVARSEEQLKNDIINHIKQLTIAGEAIMPDTAVRMKKIN